MLVRATQKGYYGERIREPGTTFNYTPRDKKAFDKGDEKLPSWMVAVNADPEKSAAEMREAKLMELSSVVEGARQDMKDAEDRAKRADEDLSKAKTKADKEVAADAAQAANDALDDAVNAFNEAEEALAAAESE